MNKNTILDFLVKYNLKQRVEETKWTVKNKSLLVKFRSEDRAVMGVGLLNEFDIPDSHFGVYNTKKMISAVEHLDKDINVELLEEGGEYTNLIFADKDVKNKRTLASVDMITNTFTGLALYLSNDEFSSIGNRVAEDFKARNNSEGVTIITDLLQNNETKISEYNNKKQSDENFDVNNSELKAIFSDREDKLKHIILSNAIDDNIKYEILHHGFDTDMELDDNFLTKFKKTKKIKDSQVFAIKINPNKTASFIINYSENNVDTGNFTVDIKRGNPTTVPMVFSFDTLETILDVNKNIVDGRLQYSSKYRVMKFTFKDDNMSYQYYTVAKQQN